MRYQHHAPPETVEPANFADFPKDGSPEFWTNRDGEIHVTEMDDDHLVNTVHWLERRASMRWRGLADAMNVLPKLGVKEKHLKVAVEPMYDRGAEMFLPTIYYTMLQEMRQRHLVPKTSPLSLDRTSAGPMRMPGSSRNRLARAPRTPATDDWDYGFRGGSPSIPPPQSEYL